MWCKTRPTLWTPKSSPYLIFNVIQSQTLVNWRFSTYTKHERVLESQEIALFWPRKFCRSHKNTLLEPPWKGIYFVLSWSMFWWGIRTVVMYDDFFLKPLYLSGTFRTFLKRTVIFRKCGNFYIIVFCTNRHEIFGHAHTNFPYEFVTRFIPFRNLSYLFSSQ